MDVIHNVIWRIAFLVECTINYCLQLCFLALTGSRSGVLICVVARTNRRQSESQTLKQENENEKHWHNISQQKKKCWEFLLNSYISLKSSEGMWPQPENEDTWVFLWDKHYLKSCVPLYAIGKFFPLYFSVNITWRWMQLYIEYPKRKAEKACLFWKHLTQHLHDNKQVKQYWQYAIPWK